MRKWTTEERRPLKKPRNTLEDNTKRDISTMENKSEQYMNSTYFV